MLNTWMHYQALLMEVEIQQKLEDLKRLEAIVQFDHELKSDQEAIRRSSPYRYY
jgi:hypothetical protein